MYPTHPPRRKGFGVGNATKLKKVLKESKYSRDKKELLPEALIILHVEG